MSSMSSLFIGLFLKYKNIMFNKFKRNKLKDIKHLDWDHKEFYNFPSTGYQVFPNGTVVIWGQTEKAKEINEPLPLEIKDISRANVQISNVEKAFYAVFNSTTNTTGDLTPYKNEVISELKHIRSTGQKGWIKRIYTFSQVIKLTSKELIISSTHPVRLNYVVMEF